MSNLRIRPARATDRSAVVAICGDEDYIPHEWDGWLADPCGELAVSRRLNHTGGTADDIASDEDPLP